ncbi:MAG: hypothetical protein CMJ18_24745 [Phycisphaeraceae bacterium]|nr:hypothetical protein [Phycisphaeraceae bacterium]
MSRGTTLILFVLISTAFAVPGRGDEVKIGLHWYRGVALQDVEDGQLILINAAGTEIRAGLDRVGGIKSDGHPTLGEAQDAIDSKDDDKALKLLKKTKGKVRTRWLRHWRAYQHMRAAARIGDAVETVEGLMELVRDRADDYYFDEPPAGVFRGADRRAVERARRLLSASRRTAKGPAAAAITAMNVAAAARLETLSAAAMTPDGDGAPSPDAARAASPSAPTASPSAVALTAALDGKDAVTQMLRRGEFDAARKAAEGHLRQSSEFLARRLYQRGRALLALADRDGDSGLYRSAGLDFMRIVVYRPRSSAYVGAALLELGYVHQKLDRHDLAAKLFDRARLYIDEDDEPDLAGRLDRLTAPVDANPD